MSKLTPLRMFYTNSNHFSKKKKKKNTHGYKAPSFTDPSATAEMRARSC